MLKSPSPHKLLPVLVALLCLHASADEPCPPETNPVLNDQEQKVLTQLSPALTGLDSSMHLSTHQKLTIEQLTSIFENSTTDFQYGYIEDIDDGVGITCGRVGFTVGELLLMVDRYVKAKGGHTPLARWIPCLTKQGADIAKDYSCLFPSVDKKEMTTKDFKSGKIARVDFGADWVAAAKDPLMRKLQDKYVDDTYFEPSMSTASRLGLHTALGYAMIYDANIQMDTEPLFEKIQQSFAKAHHGRLSPKDRAEEADWLRIYVTERKRILSGTVPGAATTPRVDSLNQILKSGNLDLKPPIKITYFTDAFTLR